MISRHVAALEAELGSRLFERTGRGMALTSVGQHLAPRLRAALEAMQCAVHEAAELGKQPNGVVRVGVVPTATQPLVGLLYQRMNERFPLVLLEFVEGFSNEVEERLAGGSLDLAIVNRYNRLRRRGEQMLCVVNSMVIGPPGAFPAAQPDLPFARLADYALGAGFPTERAAGHRHDHFHSLVEVRRSTEVFDPAKRCFVARAQAPAYYLSTLSSEVPAAEFACLVRQHWSIENGLHHVLDTTMAEDASRIRRNPGVFACLRQFALNLLRGNGEHNISQALYRNALSLHRLLNYAGIREQ